MPKTTSSTQGLGVTGFRALVVGALMALTACSNDKLGGLIGPAGPEGPAGPVGPVGPPGAQGPEGRRTLVRTVAEPSGASCATGGTRLEVGPDADGDGSLADGEVDATQTRYVCNGEQGPQGAQGSTGPQGAQGSPGAVGLYGDGSAGNYTVGVGSTVDLSTPGGVSTLPAGFNLQFANITVNGTLIVPSGTVLRATNDITVNGSIVVLQGARDSGNGEANPGVSLAAAGSYHGGVGLTALQAAQLSRPGILAGGAGARSLAGNGSASSGGEGGGSLLLVARRNVLINAGGSITANGRNGTSPADVVGAGGGAGGIIIIAAKGSLTVSGAVRANGGNGASATTTGGNGEGGGGGGGGGIVHLIAPSAPSTAGTIQALGGAAGSNAAGGTFTNPGSGGGACGGHGGDGGGQLVFGAALSAPEAGQSGHILTSVTPEPEYLLLK